MQNTHTHKLADIPYLIQTIVTRKGQITIPVSIRESLGIKKGDTIAVTVEDKKVTLIPITTSLAEGYQSIPALEHPMDWKEVRRTAQEELAEHLLQKK